MFYVLGAECWVLGFPKTGRPPRLVERPFLRVIQDLVIATLLCQFGYIVIH